MTKRVQYILVGLLAGLAFWGLSELPEGWSETRLFVMALGAAIAFGFGALAMLGELGLRRALVQALALAAVTAALAGLEALSFADAREMFETGHVLVALAVVAFLPVPFLIAWGLGGAAGWRDYRVLFIESWNIVVRYLAAWLFVGVVFVVLWLLAVLLDIVGVTLLSDLLDTPLAVWLIVGGVLGLALSVVTEMPDMVSPYLLLRLLRLLLPLVLVVEVIFVLALPLRGLTHLFGQLSTASILLSTALASIALVSIAVDQDDVEAAHGPATVWSARGLALLLPVLAGLAVWAIALRVQEYGWTPGRVMAATGAGVVSGYGLLYAATVLTGRHWMGWLRRANVAMALGVIALGVLWLSPLISPEALATRSQLARYAQGRLPAAQVPLWELAHDWGNAGRRGLARLRDEAQRPEQAALAARFATLERAKSRWDMTAPEEIDLAARAKALGEVLRVLPEGTALPEALGQALVRHLGAAEFEACGQKTPAGNPGCVLVLADLAPQVAGVEAVLLRAASSGEGFSAWVMREAGWQRANGLLLGAPAPEASEALIDALLAGGPGAPEPADLRALRAGAWQLTLEP